MAKPRKIPVNELTRLAFVWAEQDRAALADAWPVGSPEQAVAMSEYEQLKAYRMKRWRRTKMEAVLDQSELVNVMQKKGGAK